MGGGRRAPVHAADRSGGAVRRRRQPALPDHSDRPPHQSSRRAGAGWHVCRAAEAQARSLVRGRRDRIRRARGPHLVELRIDRRKPGLPARSPGHVRRALRTRSQPRELRRVHVRRRQRAQHPPIPDRADRRQRQREADPPQARHRLRPGSRPVHPQRPALPPRRLVAIRRPARRLQERGQDRARTTRRSRERAWADTAGQRWHEHQRQPSLRPARRHRDAAADPRPASADPARRDRGRTTDLANRGEARDRRRQPDPHQALPVTRRPLRIAHAALARVRLLGGNVATCSTGPGFTTPGPTSQEPWRAGG